MLPRLAALLFIATICTAAPKANCPPVPSTCTCEPGESGMLSVTCEGAVLSSLFKDLGALPLERLKITKCVQPTLDILPQGPIRSLEISDCKIERIDNKIFATTFTSLEEIILANNSLTQIPDFGKLHKLLALNLNGNKIEDVPENALQGVRNVQQLRLERNKICNLSSKAFEEIKENLMLLDLSGNCLPRIPSHLRNSNKLMYLDLADNKISEINNFELMNLPILQEIRLNNNELQTMHPLAFMNVPQLKYLFLRDNLLATLDGSKLLGLSQLEVLDVTNNLLSEVPAIKDFPRLKQVLLDGNLIGKIATLTFSNSSQLQLISLQNNNISEIARNSFDSLDQMQILLLGNNSLTSLARGMFDGMRSLTFLHLRNNSISAIDPNTFSSVPNLHSLDLSYNKLSEIKSKTFANLPKLQWLDLSNNNLEGFEEGVFNQKIETILLDGNNWICDEKFDWFVKFLVINRVRTFLPQQTEIACAGPTQYAGVRLRELMIKKANDTITEGMQTLGLDKHGQKSIISSFIPGFENWNQAVNSQNLGNMAAGVPILHTITQAIPSLRTLPGMNIPASGAQPVAPNRNLNSAIEQFTAPIVRFATGGQPVASDVQQFIQSIPNFIVNIPGFGEIDLSKVDPSLIDYVLKGGQLPGITKETMDGVVNNYMKKVYEAAAASQSGKLQNGQEKFLVPMDKLPKEIVNNVMSGRPLPGLSQDETKTVTEYYTRSMVAPPPPNSVSPTGGKGTATNSGSQITELWKLLPPNYNISKIPQEVIASVMHGEFPDLKNLPEDLLNHFTQNADKMFAFFSKMSPANYTIDDILAKVPKFERPVLTTYTPYDINNVSSDMVHEEEIKARAAKMRLYTAVALGFVGVITIVVLGFFAVYLRKQRANKTRANQPTTQLTPGPPLANSTMRD